MLYNLIFPGQCACCGAALSISNQTLGCAKCYRFLIDEASQFKTTLNELTSQFDSHNFFFLNLGLHKHLLKRAKLKPSLRALNMLFEVSLGYSEFDYSKINNCDLVIPIPSHLTSLVKRGFSPAAEFGNKISNLIDVSICHTALKQRFKTKKQAKLKREARILNVANSYSTRSSLIKGKKILLVDDIITTGATIKEAIKALLLGGADSVQTLSMAASPLLSQSKLT